MPALPCSESGAKALGPGGTAGNVLPAQIPGLFAAAAHEIKPTEKPPASHRGVPRFPGLFVPSCSPGLLPAASRADCKASPALCATNFQLCHLWVFLLIKAPRSPECSSPARSPAECSDRLWGRDCFITKCCCSVPLYCRLYRRLGYF